MTQKEIAKRLKISQATVSMALKGAGRISPEMRESIQKLADEGGYQPNLAGQLLRQGRSNAVGVLFPSLTNLFYSELFQELQSRLIEDGYLLCYAQADMGNLAENLVRLRRMRVCAVIAIGQVMEQLLDFSEEGIPQVIYGGDARLDYPVNHVLPDRFKGGYDLTDFLIKKRNRRRIAFLGCSNPTELRFMGYCSALADANIEFRPELVISQSSRLDSGYAMMRRLLENHPEVDAVFCHNDEGAIGAIRAALELGRTIPGDLSLAGFDNIDLGRYTTPSLTTMEQPVKAIAEALAETLTAAVANPGEHQFRSIPCHLIERES